MRQNQVGSLLNKQQYQTPKAVVHTFEETDVITSSGVGTMTWDWEGSWDQTRNNTFVD